MKKIIFYLSLLMLGTNMGVKAQDYWVGGVQPTFTVTTTTTGDCTIGGNHFVVGSTVISGAMAVAGIGIIGGTATLSSDVNIGGVLTVAGNGTIGGTATLSSDVNIGGIFTVANNANVAGTLAVAGGTIDMNMPTDVGPRAIQANSTLYGLALLGGSAPTNGGGIGLWGIGGGLLPGGVSYSSTGVTDAGHLFAYINPSSGAATINASISSYGATFRGPLIVGNGTSLSNIVAGDALTVKERLGFYSPTDGTWRQMRGNTITSRLALFANTDTVDGSSIMMHSYYDTTSGLAGAIEYISVREDNKGHIFKCWGTNNVNTNYATIASVGSIFGRGTTISDIVGGDVVTVKDRLGFFNSVDASWRSIHGNTSAGGLSISSTYSNSDGSSIEMYGPTHATADQAGSIHYSSYGTSIFGHVFTNNDGSSNHDNLVILNDGRTVVGQDVNIASTDPNDVLTVKDRLGFYAVNATDPRIINANADQSNLTIHEDSNTPGCATIVMHGTQYSDAARRGSIWHISNGDTGLGHMFLTYKPSTSSYVPNLAIRNDKKIVIGEDLIWGPSGIYLPGDYLLYVQKGILTEKLRVANHGDGANWADFVFAKNYHLIPLNELDMYIKVNKHLPEIPTAEDVARDGVDVGAIEAKLLQKIEELTLYVIQQQKEIDTLKQQTSK